MTLNEMIRERGRMLSILDLVILMISPEIDRDFDASVLMGWLYSLAKLETYIDSKENPSAYCVINFAGVGFEQIEPLLTKFGLTTTLKALERYKELARLTHAADGANIRKSIPTSMAYVAQCLVDELSSISLLYIDPSLKHYWTHPTEGWEDVISVLDSPNNRPLANSSVEEQIVEAGRSLAVGRGTASVLHLNNVLEVGLVRMRRKLPNRWHPGQRNELDDWITAVNSYVQSTPTPSDAIRWRSVSASCAAIRSAWRHPAAHADMIFTEESAKEAYIAIRSLMREVILL